MNTDVESKVTEKKDVKSKQNAHQMRRKENAVNNIQESEFVKCSKIMQSTIQKRQKQQARLRERERKKRKKMKRNKIIPIVYTKNGNSNIYTHKL